MTDLSFAMKPPELPTTSTTTTETTEESTSASSRTALDAPYALPAGSNNNTHKTHNQAWLDNMQNVASKSPSRGQIKIKQFGKKLGGALRAVNNTVNVAKWIDDLEQDQALADSLDRVNSETADELERKEICRQAMEACLNTMKEHLVGFLDDHPQATYEEWICNLHPENKNMKMDGLTQIPLIDHRFYVADSDHRILWNEHLNDLQNPKNLHPVRHFVAARTMLKKPSNVVDSTTTTTTTATSPANNNSTLISLGEDDNNESSQPQQQEDPFAVFAATAGEPQQSTTEPEDPFVSATAQQMAQSDLLSNNNGEQQSPATPQSQPGVVDLLSL